MQDETSRCLIGRATDAEMLITSGLSIALGVGRCGLARVVSTGISGAGGICLAASFTAAVSDRGLRRGKSRSCRLANGLRLAIAPSSAPVRISVGQIRVISRAPCGCIETVPTGKVLHLACRRETPSGGTGAAPAPLRMASKSRAAVRTAVISHNGNGCENALAVLFLRAVNGATIRVAGRDRVLTIVIGSASKATGSRWDGGRGQRGGEGRVRRVFF